MDGGKITKMRREMSLTPAQDNLNAQRKREAIELCGKNRGPHDYIPIEWMYAAKDGVDFKRVTRFMCRVCFNNITTMTLLETYQEINI
jgi:hypothetical protein